MTESESLDTAFRSSYIHTYVTVSSVRRTLKTSASSPEWLRIKGIYVWNHWEMGNVDLSEKENFILSRVLSHLTPRWDCIINSYVHVRLPHQFLHSGEIVSFNPMFRWDCLINSYVQVRLSHSFLRYLTSWKCYITSHELKERREWWTCFLIAGTILCLHLPTLICPRFLRLYPWRVSSDIWHRVLW